MNHNIALSHSTEKVREIDAHRQWYYSQTFIDKESGFTPVYKIVFAKTKNDAIEKLDNWLKEKYPASKWDIHLYQANYKREARKMVAAGNWLE